MGTVRRRLCWLCRLWQGSVPPDHTAAWTFFKLFAVCRSLKKQKYNIHTHLPCTAPHPAQHPAGRLCCALAAGWHSISACAWFPQGFLCASFCHQKRSIRSFDYQSCRCFFYPSWNCIQTFFTRCSLCWSVPHYIFHADTDRITKRIPTAHRPRITFTVP